MLFGLKIKSQKTWTRKWFINLSATSTVMLTLVKLNVIFLFVNMIWTSWQINTYWKNLKHTEKDATAIRKHCHNHYCTVDTSCFLLVGNAANKYHLKLKESLLILKMKPSLNVAKESMPYYTYLKMTHNSVWVYQFNVTMITICVLTVKFKTFIIVTLLKFIVYTIATSQ